MRNRRSLLFLFFALAAIVPAQALAVKADAGRDQEVAEGLVVTLDGSASKADENGNLTFSWTQTAGPTVTLSNPSDPQATFKAPLITVKQQDLRFRLTVREGGRRVTGNSTDTDDVRIRVIDVDTGGAPPVADAGPDQTARTSTVVSLDGSRSYDPEGAKLTYSWRQTAGPRVALSGTSAATARFAAPVVAAPTTLSFELVVNDGRFTASDAVNVQVTFVANQPPAAVAGPDQAVTPGSVVKLDGSASSGSNGEALAYRWTQLSGPRVTLTDAGSSVATFTAPTTGNAPLRFRLTVTTSTGASVDDIEIRLLVEGEPTPTPTPNPNPGPIPTPSPAPAAPAPSASVSGFSIFPNPYDPNAGPAGIAYELGADCAVRVRVYDMFGGFVREFDAPGRAGPNTATWDGRNGRGEVVGNGGYVFQLEATDGAGKTVRAKDRVAVVK